MATLEAVHTSIYVGALELGMDLATPGQTIPEAIDQLNGNLAGIGCAPNVDAAAVQGEYLEQQLQQNTPPFSRAVGAASRAIFCRPEDNGPPLYVPDLSAEDIARLIQARALRKRRETTKHSATRAQQNAMLVRCMIRGLSTQGYHPADSMCDIRAEFIK